MPRTRPTAETEGSKAFANGLERSSNPYPPGEQAEQWERGWKHASKSRKAYLRHAKKQEASDQERDQMTGLDWVIHNLTPKRLQRYSSSIFALVALGGVVVFLSLAYGLKVLIAFAVFVVFLYGCAAVFVLARHHAGKYGDQPWKKTLSYTLAGLIGLIIVLIAWELMGFILETLDTFLAMIGK